MNGKEIIKLKAKKSEMVATPLCLMQTISEKKTGLYRYVYDMYMSGLYLYC